MRQQKPSFGRFHLNNFFRVRKIVVSLVLVLGLWVVSTSPLTAQTFSVIHSFTGGSDGANPWSGVTIDGAGNLYGTTDEGGNGFGAVYELKLRNGNYTVNPLYVFPGGAHGANPHDRVVFGPDGLLYGAANAGGNNNNGVAFKLQPRAAACATPLCSWMQTVLFAFPANGSGGSGPTGGDVVFDVAGDMYDATVSGGADNVGVVWELTPPGTWDMETVLASFTGSNGQDPGNNLSGGVILDGSGNLYGTTYSGGRDNDGVVFQLLSGGLPWTENVLYTFTGGDDGSNLHGGVIFDASGNLYGATTNAGSGGGGTIFELSPAGSWTTFTVLHSLTGSGGCPPLNTGAGPQRSLSMDSAGNLYGTTCSDGTHHRGNVFELSPVNGSWTYTDLYDFTGGTDGAYPLSQATCDSAGNLYGTTDEGGADGLGVVWKISGVDCLRTDAPVRP